MKKILFLFLFLFISVAVFSATATLSAARRFYVKEIDYLVSSSGRIDKTAILQERELVYDRNGRFISGNLISGRRKIEITRDSPGYTPHLFSGKNGAVSHERYSERVDGKDIIHETKYNDWGDISEHRSYPADTPNQVITTMYEYVYLDNFTYVWRNGIRFVSGLEADYNAPWVARTISKDGIVRQYTEREVSSRRW